VALLLLPIALWVSRRGVLWCLLPLLVVGPLPPVEAASSPWLTKQQRAQALYETGDYAAAAKLFEDPMRRGNALYRAGEFNAAIKAFAAQDSAESWFNRGNSFAGKGDLAQASEAYAEALQRRPGWAEAAQNKATVDEMLQQQSERNEQSDGQQSGENDQREHGEQSEGESAQSETGSPSTQQPPPEGNDPPPSEADTDQQNDTSSETPESATDTQQGVDSDSKTSLAEEQQAAAAQLMRDDLTDEEREELEQLLRRIPNDPALLLRNRLRLEAERRQHGQPPKGAQRQW
jgi:Ca-activated chloride channel family protein